MHEIELSKAATLFWVCIPFVVLGYSQAIRHYRACSMWASVGDAENAGREATRSTVWGIVGAVAAILAALCAIEHYFGKVG